MKAQLILECLDEALEDLMHEAHSKGVELDLEWQDHGEELIWLSSIERVSGRKGSGAQVLESLFEIAEEYDLTIEGQIDAPVGALAKYYRDLGFEIEIRSGRTVIIKQP